MSEAKKVLMENIVEPTAYNRSSATIEARILDTDEASNTCKIAYRDKYGKNREKERVNIRMYNVSIIDWFPKKGDLVLVEQNDDKFVVIGPHSNSYQGMKNENMLKQDVLTDTLIDTLGGYIF